MWARVEYSNTKKPGLNKDRYQGCIIPRMRTNIHDPSKPRWQTNGMPCHLGSDHDLLPHSSRREPHRGSHLDSGATWPFICGFFSYAIVSFNGYLYTSYPYSWVESNIVFRFSGLASSTRAPGAMM